MSKVRLSRRKKKSLARKLAWWLLQSVDVSRSLTVFVVCHPVVVRTFAKYLAGEESCTPITCAEKLILFHLCSKNPPKRVEANEFLSSEYEAHCMVLISSPLL
jgi:hypothetical protein